MAKTKYSYAVQIKLDVFYSDLDEIVSFKNAIKELNKNSEFKIEIPQITTTQILDKSKTPLT